MTYEEIYNRVVDNLNKCDVSIFQTISDIIDLHNDKIELGRLKSIYSDYVSLCNSREFNRIQSKYCG